MPFVELTNYKLIKLQHKQKFTVDPRSHFTKHCCKTIYKLLEGNPEIRMTIDEAQEMKWVKQQE
jgi:hypothetical protein